MKPEQPQAVPDANLPHFQLGQIDRAPEVRLEMPDVQPITGYTYVGFTMAKIFSGILAGYLVLAAGSIWFSEARMLAKMDSLTKGLTITEMRKTEGQSNPVTKDDVEALTKSVAEAYREARATTVEFHKTVIVNVLLPILAALLGYIFGNREKNGPNQAGK